jgi:hypothetical protein
MSTAPTPVAAVAPIAPAAAPAKESFLQKVEGVFEKDGKKVLSVMDAVAQDADKGLVFVLKYAPRVESLVAIAFPGATVPLQTGVAVLTLVQNAVIATKQKAALINASTATSAEKEAEEVALVGSTVNTLLTQAGVTEAQADINKLIALVVAALNIQPVAAAA